jgi:hypothetical protein
MRIKTSKLTLKGDGQRRSRVQFPMGDFFFSFFLNSLLNIIIKQLKSDISNLVQDLRLRVQFLMGDFFFHISEEMNIKVFKVYHIYCRLLSWLHRQDL